MRSSWASRWRASNIDVECRQNVEPSRIKATPGALTGDTTTVRPLGSPNHMNVPTPSAASPTANVTVEMSADVAAALLRLPAAVQGRTVHVAPGSSCFEMARTPKYVPATRLTRPRPQVTSASERRVERPWSWFGAGDVAEDAGSAA